MKTLSMNLYLTAGCMLALSMFTGCSKGNQNNNPSNNPPAITSLSVTSGNYQTYVTISGTGFSTTAANDKVAFNGVPATILNAGSATQILVSVPLAAGTGNVTITVNGQTAKGGIFTYIPTEVAVVLAGSSNMGAVNGQGTAASFGEIDGLAIDASGNVYVGDQFNNLIRAITPQGLVTTLAGSGSVGLANGIGTAASFSQPSGVATDSNGNVYVADTGNGSIMEITSNGQVSTITDSSGVHKTYGHPYYMATDLHNNVFFCDQGGSVIREITSAGMISTYFTASGSFNGFYGLAIDKSGNIYGCDDSGNEIDKVSNGVMSVFAGNASIIGGGLNGTGGAASFSAPYGLTISAAGNLFIMDRGNQDIREVTSAAVVTTFAAGGGGFYEGPVNMVSFAGQTAIMVDASNSLYIADGHAIRKISVQ
jgi:hypothetical protein